MSGKGRIWMMSGTALLALTLFSQGSSAQSRSPRPSEEQSREAREHGSQRPGARRPGVGGQDRPLRALFQRLAPLPAEEQQRRLENDEVFQQLPPRAQERFRQRLREFNALPGAERQRMLEQGDRADRGRDLFLRLAPLSPDEQQRVLASDEAFQTLPPEAQQRFRRRLGEFNRRSPEAKQSMLDRFERFAELPPQGKQRVRERAQRFAEMSPEQRQKAQRLFRAWQELPPDRQQLLRERLRELERTPALRRGTLGKDPEFLSGLSPAEQDLFQALVGLRQNLAPPEPPPPGPAR